MLNFLPSSSSVCAHGPIQPVALPRVPTPPALAQADALACRADWPVQPEQDMRGGIPALPAPPEAVRRRLAHYELQQARHYARQANTERMHAHLRTACDDLQALGATSAQLKVVRLQVINTLMRRIKQLSIAGDATTVDHLIREMRVLGSQFARPPEALQGCAALQERAKRQAVRNLLEQARQAADLGDACQVLQQLAAAQEHTEAQALQAERVLLFYVCVRRLADMNDNLFLRFCQPTFVMNQLRALEVLAGQVEQEVPASVYRIAAMMAGLRAEAQEYRDGSDANDGEVKWNATPVSRLTQRHQPVSANGQGKAAEI